MTLFAGHLSDPPNRDPWVDARAGVAHFVYRSKALDLRYLQIDPNGTATSISFPTGTNANGRVAVLPGGASVVVAFDPASALLSAFRIEPGSTVPVAAPGHDGSRQRSALTFELAAFGDEVAVATATTSAAPSVIIEALGATGWRTLGELVKTETIARVRLASSGSSLAAMILSGTTNRSVHVWRDGAWAELAGLPPSGVIAVPSLVVDGSRIFYLESQQDSGRSVVWLHDGTSWSEWARSDPKEGFHGLTLHRGALYTLSGDPPNMGAPRTLAIARLDRAAISRGFFDGATANANIDSESRHYAMSQEKSQLVSRDGDLFLAYEEGSVAFATTRLYRLVPP